MFCYVITKTFIRWHNANVHFPKKTNALKTNARIDVVYWRIFFYKVSFSPYYRCNSMLLIEMELTCLQWAIFSNLYA